MRAFRFVALLAVAVTMVLASGCCSSCKKECANGSCKRAKAEPIAGLN
jgi:hypothetical protein